MTPTLTSFSFSTLPLTLSLVLIPGLALGSTGGAPPLLDNSTRIFDPNVPIDGVVAGQSECGSCNMEEVWIITAGSKPVEGVVTDLSDLRGVGAWAFTPSSPWLPGEYLAGYANGDTAPFTVVDVMVAPPVVQPILGPTNTESGEYAQCFAQAPSAENPEGEFASFARNSSTYGYFRAVLFGRTESQYTYTTGVNGEVRFAPYFPEPHFEIMPGTDEICYWVRAERLVSGEETLLADDCYSPPELDEYVVQNSGPEEFEAFLREKCVLPPVGHVSEWCASFQTAIDEGTCSVAGVKNVEACESALNLCVTGDSSGGTSLGGASSGSNGDGDSSGGCTVSTPRGSNPLRDGGAWFIVLASIAALRFRRAPQPLGR